MFDLAVLRRTDTGTKTDAIDVGLLAETLLFYQKTHLLLNDGTLAHFLKTIGPDLLLELLDRPGVSASFLRERLVTVSTGQGPLTSYNFAQIMFDPPATGRKKSKHINDKNWVEYGIEKQLGAGGPTKRFTRKLLEKISLVGYKDTSTGSKGLSVLAREELSDSGFIKEAIAGVLRELLPSFVVPHDWYFDHC
jgi:hypothetical protein